MSNVVSLRPTPAQLLEQHCTEDLEEFILIKFTKDGAWHMNFVGIDREEMCWAGAWIQKFALEHKWPDE